MESPIEAMQGELADGGLARFLKAADQASLYGVLHVSGETPAILVLASGRLVLCPTLDGTPTERGRSAMVDLLCDLLADKDGTYRCAPLLDVPNADELESAPAAKILMEALIRRVSTSRVRPTADEADQPTVVAAAEPTPARAVPPPVIPTPVAPSSPPPGRILEAHELRRAHDLGRVEQTSSTADIRQRRAADLRQSLRAAQATMASPQMAAAVAHTIAATPPANEATPPPRVAAPVTEPDPPVAPPAVEQPPAPPQPVAEPEAPRSPSRRRALRNLIRTLTS